MRYDDIADIKRVVVRTKALNPAVRAPTYVPAGINRMALIYGR